MVATQKKQSHSHYDKEDVRATAAHRWPEILENVGHFEHSVLDGRGCPCPKCGGTDRFCFFPNDGTGGVLCRRCFGDKSAGNNGDGFSAIGWMLGIGFDPAVSEVAKYLGMAPSTNGSSNRSSKSNADPAKDLTFLCWCPMLAKVWCHFHKRGITPDAMLACGCRFARYHSDAVFAFPIQQPSPSGPPTIVGWSLYQASGQKLPVFEKGKKEPIDWVKVKTTWKSKPGFIGPVDKLPSTSTVWKLEGISDVLAFASLSDRSDAIAITNACGAGEKPVPWMLEQFTDKTVRVLHDADEAGERGAAGYATETGKHRSGWAELIAGSAKECRHVHLPSKGEDGLKDLRDWINLGHCYTDLAALAAAAPIITSAKGLPDVHLPGGETTITEAAGTLGELLGATGRFFSRGGVAVRLIDSLGAPQLEPIRAPALCSDLETVARLLHVKKTKTGEKIEPTTCSESTARLILECSAFRSMMPTINVVSACPVLIEDDGRLMEVSKYHRASGILAGGKATQDIDLAEAVELLTGLVSDYKFASLGDKARAVAAFITPALVFGGLLNGRAPVDLSEADVSQAGKGYRNKITAAIYNARPRIVTQRATGGVGSVQENFDSALVSGACFVPFDNFRGRLDLPGLESFLTEDSYPARVPYAGTMVIDPRRVIIMFTSNAAEVTVDLANRCSCTRILKQSAEYKFATYPEGDLLKHVLANQPRYLGAVFAVVKEWHRRGKPELETTGHDFRRWARVLGYISESILGTRDLLVGHREAQQRIASPGLTWLRDVALAVHKAKQGGLSLRPHHLLTIIANSGIVTPGVDTSALDGDNDAWLKATQAIGRKLGNLFRDGDTITIDAGWVQRDEVTDNQYRKRTEFAFFP